MLRKALVIIAAVTISVFCLSGCKKRSEEAKPGEPAKEVRKAMADYTDEAKKEINKENMAEELEKLEKEIEEDIVGGL
jgi:outer membrane murein-binding lipoprotein Lpp